MKVLKKVISKYLKGKKGFTLVELIIAMAVFSIVMVAYSSLFLTGSKTYGLVYDGYKAQNEARIAMSFITVKIRKNDRLITPDPVADPNYECNAVSIVELLPSGKYMQIVGDTTTEYIYAHSTGGATSLIVTEDAGQVFTGSGDIIAEGLAGITMDYIDITDTNKIVVEIGYNNGVTSRIEETILLRSQT